MSTLMEGFKEVFGILKALGAGLKELAKIPGNNITEMRDAVADTAELIDETLTILRQHLTVVISELRFGDPQNAAKMIYELSNFQGWEDKYRKFQLCDSLRIATGKLESKGLYKLINLASFGNPETIHQRMFDYIGGETNAAKSIGTMLIELSQLAGVAETDRDRVIRNLEDARNEVGIMRQAFIDLEIEIRKLM